ncbi:MAG: glycosyltransferase family 2 protein [Verrucomicrobium sp.]|nr:glycosyltransferase [Verrucomicrobium sp.]
MSNKEQVSSLAAWIVVPVFNRRDLTLSCLEHLAATGVLDWAHVVVADGGSTDGTQDQIRLRFPQIEVLEGRWWWMEGIRAGMEHAQKQGAEVFVWLNDDCRPELGSVEALVHHVRTTGFVCGGLTRSGGGVYAGMRKTIWGLRAVTPPEYDREAVIPVDSLVGNFVAIPIGGVVREGLPDAHQFPHSCADHYYTIAVAKHCGGICHLLCAAQATDVHPAMGWERQSILRGSQPVPYIARQLMQWTPRVGLQPELRLHRRIWGPWGYVLVLAPWLKKWLLLAVRVTLPAGIRKKL